MPRTDSRVLVVDDEPEIRRALESGLRHCGYEVVCVATGEQAIDAVREVPFSLIILDLALPGMGGLDVCRAVRSFSSMPIIVLSVRNSEREKIAALDTGADDFVTKPFAMGELLARMRAAMRRAPVPRQVEPVAFEGGDLRMDFLQRRVVVRGDDVKLTPREYDLLHFLVTHSDRILTHRQVLKTVWGDDYADDKPLLRVHIANLRQKIESVPARPRYIINEPGVGYRFCPQLDERAGDAALSGEN